MEITPLDLLNDGESVFQKDHGYHYHSPYRGSTGPLRPATIRVITHASKSELDTNDIEHNLSDQELRVLFKILGKCYCLLYTSPSPRDVEESRMPSSA